MIIGRLRGTVAALGTDSVMIDVNGVGYVALAGSGLLSRLTVGAEAEIFIETRVTESSITLFAFSTDEERAWFVRLQDVPGVAGKSAMAIMDAVSASELMDALALGDTAPIIRAKGVGKKLASGSLANCPANRRQWAGSANSSLTQLAVSPLPLNSRPVRAAKRCRRWSISAIRNRKPPAPLPQVPARRRRLTLAR